MLDDKPQHQQPTTHYGYTAFENWPYNSITYKTCDKQFLRLKQTSNLPRLRKNPESLRV